MTPAAAAPPALQLGTSATTSPTTSASPAPPGGSTSWALIGATDTPPRPPRKAAADAAPTAASSSSVSSPTSRDADDEHDVDELLEGIDRVRIDDLWSTPRSGREGGSASRRGGDGATPATPASGSSGIRAATAGTLRFRAGLFAPPGGDGIAAIAAAVKKEEGAGGGRMGPRSVSQPLGRQGGLRGVVKLPHAKSLHASQVGGYREQQHAAEWAAAEKGGGAEAQDEVDFPSLFKVYPCATVETCVAGGKQADCFYYHSVAVDRRRRNFSLYKPHMCRFVEEVGGCRKGDRCPFSHNDFERRYHPDRFGKETCRDFLRGDCPRRYCTFKHEVSGKVEVAITQMDSMNDKELLQLVLKISDVKGKALSEKLLRRFGHGKKHSGWRLEGFNAHGRGDQKVKFVSARVETLKKVLRATGEKKWASSLKTSSLRDMMSGVRKVAEEVRERHRDDQLRGEAGPEMHRLIRSVFQSTNWSCHSQEGDNPFLVTPENQNDAVTALERLVEVVIALAQGGTVGAGPGPQPTDMSYMSQHHNRGMHPHHAHHQQQRGYGLRSSHYPQYQLSQQQQHRHRLGGEMGPYIPEIMPHQAYYGQAPPAFAGSGAGTSGAGTGQDAQMPGNWSGSC